MTDASNEIIRKALTELIANREASAGMLNATAAEKLLYGMEIRDAQAALTTGEPRP